jgi:Transposase, Mutator family
VNKKLPVMPAKVRELEAARVAGLSVQPRLPLAELQGAIREGLMAFSCAAGLVVIAEMMEEERTRIVGPKGRHDPERVAERNGRAPGSVVLGGRRVPVSRPRAVRVDGSGEVALDSYSVFSSADLLTQVALERMLAGVATRRHALVAEPIGEALEAVARGDSKSAVSRRFKTATEAKLAELLARDLSGLDVAAMMIDGIIFAECCVVVALAITADGTKVPVGLWEGESENTTVVKDLLADLVARGMGCPEGVLFVLDGSKPWLRGSKGCSGTGCSSNVAPSTSGEIWPTTCPKTTPPASTASWPGRSTTLTRNGDSRSPRASPPNSRSTTPRPRPASGRAWRTCSRCAASAPQTASPAPCTAPTPSSR